MLWRLLLCALAATAGAQTRTVEVDAANVIGTIRSLQGVNDGPAPLLPGLADVSAQYRDLRINLVRTHDFFGPGDIDAQWPDPDSISKRVKADGSRSIFPNWSADPEQEASYNFGPTDQIMKAIVNCGAEVYFRVGRSWSADPAPPPDFDKYARIVRHVAMHYNRGWAHGFQYKIRSWEFWNEPDLKESWSPGNVREFWSGTPEQFYALYEKVARELKAYDPTLQVGAPGKAAGSVAGPYREGLIAYCAAHKVPLDFYSWHHYVPNSADPFDFVRIAQDLRGLLDGQGLRQTRIHVTEWNIGFESSPLRKAPAMLAAFCAATQIYLQDSPMDRSLFYRGDSSSAGLFDKNGAYRKPAYAYKALGAMLDTPQRLAVKGADTLGFAVLAGRSADGRTVQVLISNYEIPQSYRPPRPPSHVFSSLERRKDIQYRDNRGYALKVKNLPWAKGESTVKRYRITSSQDWAETSSNDGSRLEPLNRDGLSGQTSDKSPSPIGWERAGVRVPGEAESSGQAGALEMCNPLPPPGVELIVIRHP